MDKCNGILEKHSNWDEVYSILEIICPSHLKARVLHVTKTKNKGFKGILNFLSIRALGCIFPRLSRREKFKCEPPQTYNVDSSALVMIRKCPHGVLFNEWELLWPHCIWQFSALSRKNPPLFVVYIGCWRQSSKSIKDDSHLNKKARATQRLASYTLSFSSIFQMTKMDVDMCIALPSLPSFLWMPLSPLFIIWLLILIFVGVDLAHSFWNFPCMNYCTCSKVPFRKELAVRRKSVPLALATRVQFNQQTHVGLGSLYSPSYPIVQGKMQVHKYCKGTHWLSLQRPAVSEVNSRWFHLCACYSHPWEFLHITNMLLIEKTAAHWTWSIQPVCRKRGRSYRAAHRHYHGSQVQQSSIESSREERSYQTRAWHWAWQKGAGRRWSKTTSSVLKVVQFTGWAPQLFDWNSCTVFHCTLQALGHRCDGRASAGVEKGTVPL